MDDDQLCTCGHTKKKHVRGFCCTEFAIGRCTCTSFTRDYQAERLREKSLAATAARQSRIKQAAPFIDALWDGKGWKPSELLVIGSGLLLQKNGVTDIADGFLDGALDDARSRFRKGDDPNPFAKAGA